MKNMEQMSAKERFLGCLFREETDRVSVANPTSVATVEQMEAVNAFFPDVHTNPEKMADLAAAGYEILGFDTISPYFSVQQEAAALGCELDWGEIDAMPVARTHPIVKPEDFQFPADFLDRQPIKTVLDSIKILKKKYGNQVAIVGKVMGPWTLSYNLHGVQDFLLKTILDPQEVRDFLEIFKQVTIEFANAQLEAGADVITLADHATGDMVSGETYRDFLLGAHQELAQAIQGPIILHICGKTLDRLPYIAQTGFDAFHFDSKNGAKAAKEVVGDKMVLVGDINNPKTLLNGETEDVRKEVYEALDAGIEIIGPECAVPLRTPNKNLQAIVDGVKRYGEECG